MVSRRMPVIRRILCTLLVCALLTGLLPAAFAAGSDPDFSAPADKVLISQTNYPIVNGLTESQVILNNASGSAQIESARLNSSHNLRSRMPSSA